MRARVLLSVLVALAGAPALAQDDSGSAASEPAPQMQDSPNADAAEPPSAGEPQPLTPPVSSPSSSDQTVIRAAPSVMGRRGSGAVEMGTLGTTEGPVAGTLNETNGGLGANAWSGVSRADAIAALSSLPPPASPTVRGLLYKLLATAASPPSGRSETSFNAVRIRTLMNAGMVAEAAAIAAQVRAPKDAETSRVQADALLLAGDDVNACGDATAYRMESDDPFWIELRAYCYALAKDPALDLTRAVLGASDSAFNALLDGVIAGRTKVTVAIAHPTALHVRLMQRLNMPLGQGVLDLGTAGAVIAVAAPKTPKDVRIAAADKALHAGALSPSALSATLDLIPFTAADLNAAAAMARSDNVIVGLARLRAALKVESNPTKRAELVYTAFRIGEDQHFLFQIAPVFVPEALTLTPTQEWANWGVTYARAFILTGNEDAAQRWLNVVRDSPISPDELMIDLAVGTRNPAAVQAAQSALVNLSQRAMADPDGSGARAALVFGLFDALALPMPPEAAMSAQTWSSQQWPGFRPSAAQMKRIEDASLHNRRGAVILGTIVAVGQTPNDLAPDITVRLVRALQTAGIHDAAHVLATEAVLAR